MSNIEWTGTTWNPVTGCDTISPGCSNCYARTLAKRLKAMGQYRYQNDGNPVTSGPGFAVSLHHEALTTPLRWRKPRLVFVNSMSDLCHARVPDEFLAAVVEVMAATPQHTYQVLTKRPRRLPVLDTDRFRMLRHTFAEQHDLPWQGSWDLPNLWLGTSIESGDYTWRADALRQASAAVRFLSCEPLLGPLENLDLTGIGWVIAGGESGPGHRPADPGWFRDLRDQCADVGVPFFFKQHGGRTPKAGGRELDGRVHDDMPAVQ